MANVYPKTKELRELFGYSGARICRQYDLRLETLIEKHKYMSSIRKNYLPLLRSLSNQSQQLSESNFLPIKSELRNLQCKLDRAYESFFNRIPKTIGFLGEFSSGKSTFINAILGTIVLPSHAIEGTTVYPVEICYGSLSAEFILDDGTVERLQGRRLTKTNLINPLMERISELGLEDQVNRLRVCIPDKKLRYVTLIDTPGINSAKQAHTVRAINAIKNLCDSFLVVTPAIQPLTQHLALFLENNFANNKEEMAFLVTKCDLLRKESDKMAIVDHLSTRIIASFQPRTLPKIILSSAAIPLAVKMKQCPNSGRVFPIEEFKIKREITDFRRTTRYISKLPFDTSLQAFEHQIEQCKQDAIRILSAVGERPYQTLGLVDTTKSLPSFEIVANDLSTMKSKIHTRLDQITQSTNQELQIAISRYFGEAQDATRRMIDGIENKGRLEAWAKNTLLSNLREICYKVSATVFQHLKSMHKDSQAVLEKHLSNVTIRDLQTSVSLSLVTPLYDPNVDRQLWSVSNSVNNASSQLGLGVGVGGAASGAGLGAIMFGPLGFLAGGVIGAVVGTKLNIVTATEKTAFRNEISTAMQSLQNTVQNSAQLEVLSFARTAKQAVSDACASIQSDFRRHIADEIENAPDVKPLTKEASKTLKRLFVL
jgi:hypothetical protein